MPIYAYRCEACGFAKDVLQKVSDPQLTVCLSCGAASFKKQLTAAGFQLKGTGWYATDFRNGAGTTAPAVAGNEGAANGETKPAGNDKSGGDTASAGNDKAVPAAGKSGSAAAPAAPAASAPSTPNSAA